MTIVFARNMVNYLLYASKLVQKLLNISVCFLVKIKPRTSEIMLCLQGIDFNPELLLNKLILNLIHDSQPSNIFISPFLVI